MTKPPYKTTLGTLTSVVCDPAGFDRAIDALKTVLEAQTLPVWLPDHTRMTGETLEQVRAKRAIKWAQRGPITQPLFDLFDVATDEVAVVVRGYGKTLMAELGLHPEADKAQFLTETARELGLFPGPEQN